MARPKKYKEDTEVVSFRVPKKMKAEIRKAVEDLLMSGKTVLHIRKEGDKRTAEVTVKHLTEVPPKTNYTIDTQSEIKKYEDQIKSLENCGVKSVLTQKTIRLYQNKIYDLKYPK